MRINERRVLLTPRVILVPYSKHHVPTYHEWMQDEELRKQTASELLTLEEEHAMQKSWRNDHDKLTFIICRFPALTGTTSPFRPLIQDAIRLTQYGEIHVPLRIQSMQYDKPEDMIGDINLYLSDLKPDDSVEYDEWLQSMWLQHEQPETLSPEKVQRLHDIREYNRERFQAAVPVVGEINIMIARPEFRGKGNAKEALLLFLHYIHAQHDDIMWEYHGGQKKLRSSSSLPAAELHKPLSRIKYLKAVIKAENASSIGLYKSVGFKQVAEKPNYFGDLEFRARFAERLYEPPPMVGGGPWKTAYDIP